MTDSLSDILLIGIAVAFLLVIVAFVVSLVASKGAIPENQKTMTPVVGPLTVNKGMFITAAVLFIIAALPIGFIIDFGINGPGLSSSAYANAGKSLGAAILASGITWLIYAFSFHKSWHDACSKILKIFGFLVLGLTLVCVLFLAYLHSIPGNLNLSGVIDGQSNYAVQAQPYATVLVFLGVFGIGLWTAYFLGKSK
jgi:hypothetical protein